MSEVQDFKNEFEDDELKALIAENMSQTFSSENISVSEDLIAKTLGRIKALPVNETPVVSAEELEAKRREKLKKRNRIIASLSTVAAALVIGLIGINFIGSTKQNAKDSAPMRTDSGKTAYSTEETTILSEANGDSSSGITEEKSLSIASVTMVEDSCFTSGNASAEDNVYYEEAEYDYFDDCTEAATEAEPDSVTEYGYGFSEISKGDSTSTMLPAEPSAVEGGYASDGLDFESDSVPVYEIAEAEFPDKYQELSSITEEIISNSPETEEKVSDISLVVTLTSEDGVSSVFFFGDQILCETEYPADVRYSALSETCLYVPGLEEYIEDIYEILQAP